MDDAKIDALAKEVLSSLKKAPSSDQAVTSSPARAPIALRVEHHASESLLSVEGGTIGGPCVLDAGQLCVGSLRCRSLGH